LCRRAALPALFPAQVPPHLRHRTLAPRYRYPDSAGVDGAPGYQIHYKSALSQSSDGERNGARAKDFLELVARTRQVSLNLGDGLPERCAIERRLSESECRCAGPLRRDPDADPNLDSNVASNLGSNAGSEVAGLPCALGKSRLPV